MRQFLRISAIAAASVVIFALSGCNKLTSTIPETTSGIVNETLTEIETVETSGENLVSNDTVSKSTEDNTEENTEDVLPSESVKNSEQTTGESTSSSSESETETTKADSKSETTGTKPVVSETTTQAPGEKATEKTSEAATEKQTEKTTEAPTQKQTEKATEAHKHSYTGAVTTPATCASEGVMTYRCSCGDSYTETIGKTAHSFGGYTYNNDATYESDGTETAVCSVCGERSTRTAGGTKLVHVHSYTSSVTKAATCSGSGVVTYTCSCGDSYTESIPMTAHSYGDYVYNNDATTDADGTKTATCSVCGAADTVTAEGTKKSLPSWYDEHTQQLNVATGAQDDGSLEAYFVAGQFDWTGVSNGCWDFDYSSTADYIGTYSEGSILHGYLYKCN